MRAHVEPISDESPRDVTDLIRRFHAGRWPTFRRMIASKRVGDQVVEVAQWRSGGFAVVFWPITADGLSWRSTKTRRAARSIFDRL